MDKKWIRNGQEMDKRMNRDTPELLLHLYYYYWGKMTVTRIVNCRIVRNHQIETDYLFIENGVFIDPIDRFFNQRRLADNVVGAYPSPPPCHL